MHRIAHGRLGQPVIHRSAVTPSSRDAGQIIERKPRRRVAEVKRAFRVQLGLIQLATPKEGAGQVNVRGMMIAEGLQDPPKVVDALAEDFAKPLVAPNPLAKKA